MKRTNRRYLLILLALALLVSALVPAAAAGIVGDVNGDGKVSVFDAQLLLEAQAGIRELTAEQQTNKGESTVQSIINTVLTTVVEGGDTEEEPTVDPNAIAQVVTGENTTYVTTVDEMTAAVDASGNTTVKMLKDVTHTTQIKFPYSLTLDLNGHTITTNLTSGNCMQIVAVGSENDVTTVKNGKLHYNTLGIRVNAGGIVVSNMTLQGVSGAAVGIYDPSAAYRNINRIENSTLSSGEWGCVTFNAADKNFSNTGITIENSDLISHKAGGSYVLVKANAATEGGDVILGEGVNLYSYQKDISAPKNIFVDGKAANRDIKTHNVEVGGVTYENMNRWSTDIELETRNFLFIGNSFCYYWVEELYGIAKADGIELNIGNLYEAGCFVEEHWNWLNNKTENYQFWLTNSMGRFRHAQIMNSYDALKYQDWEIISLQQHFNPNLSTGYDVAIGSCTPYVKNLFDYLKTNNPNAELYWHQTWAYQVGHGQMPDVATQTTQYESILEASKTICQENGVLRSPNGDAWQIARANAALGDTLCARAGVNSDAGDYYHDGDLGGGQYLNACVWYEVLTGNSCIGNKWRPDYALSEEKITALQQAAHQAVLAVYGQEHFQ